MYDKFFIINNIGLIQITHIFRIFVKIYRRILRILGFFEIGCPLCSKGGRFWIKSYVDSVEKNLMKD
jgi:hypothetical protein